MFQILSVSSISEEHYSKTTIYRIKVYTARHSAGNVIIKMKEGKMCGNTIQMWQIKTSIYNAVKSIILIN